MFLPEKVRTALRSDFSEARRRWRMRHVRQRFAYIGAGIADNVGDHALFEAISALAEGVGARVIRVPHHRRERRLARFRLSGPAYFTGLIVGGGTLVNRYWLEEVQRWRRVKPSWLFGTGVGSSGYSQDSEAVDSSWSSVLSGFSALAVRGPLSAERLTSLAVPEAVVIGDAALALSQWPGVQELTERADRRHFLVNVAGSSDAGAGELALSIEAVVAASQVFLGAGLVPLPVAFSAGDETPTAEVMHRLGVSVAIARPDSAMASLRLLATCKVGVSVRLHGAILAACVATPCLLVTYRDKGWDYLRSVNSEHLGLALSTPPDAVRAAARLLVDASGREGEHVRREALYWAEKQAQFAEEQWKARVD